MDIYTLLALAGLITLAAATVTASFAGPGDPPPPPSLDDARGYLVRHGNLIERRDLL